MANEEAGGTEAFVHAQMAAQRAAAEDDGVDAERRQKFVESCTLKSHRYQAARSADGTERTPLKRRQRGSGDLF